MGFVLDFVLDALTDCSLLPVGGCIFLVYLMGRVNLVKLVYNLAYFINKIALCLAIVVLTDAVQR